MASEEAYKLVRTLAEACEIVLHNYINENDINRLETLLKSHHELYSKIFGEYSVSINYHMVLHHLTKLRIGVLQLLGGASRMKEELVS